MYKGNYFCFLLGVIPEETVLLASNSQGFAGEQCVLSLTLLSRNVENEGKNSQRNVAVLQTIQISSVGCSSAFSTLLSREDRGNC